VKVVDVEFMLMPEYTGEFVDPNGNKQALPKLPAKSRREDAGYDVYSAEDGIVPANGSRNFPTGVKLAVPLGYFYSIRGRSGLGFKGVRPFIGTLDATYNNQVMVLLVNSTSQDFEIKKGDRIAQIVIEEQIEMNPKEVTEFSPPYNVRGQAGFGSSGR